MLKRNVILSIIILSLLIVLVNCNGKDQSQIIVTAGNAELTEGELNYLLPEGFRDEMSSEIFRFIEDWATEEILAEAAQDINLHKRPDIQYQLEEARRMILASAYEREVVASRVNIDSSEVYEYYLENIDEFIRSKDEVRCAHFMVSDSLESAIADSLLDTLMFEEVAIQFSHDPKNIDIGYFAKDEMHPQLAASAFKLQEGEQAGPIETEYGYHYIQLLDFAPKGTAKEFADLEDVLRDIIAEKKFRTAYGFVIDSLKGEKALFIDSSSVLGKVQNEK